MKYLRYSPEINQKILVNNNAYTIGAEIEFYLDREYELLWLEKLLCNKVHKERGKFQYEVITKPTTDISLVVSSIDAIYSKLNDIDAITSPLPFNDDYPNGLHLHISHSKFSKENIRVFAHGLCSDILRNIHIFAPKAEDYKRFNMQGFLAPTHVSYGYNNRSCCVRIISDPIFIDQVRLEHRLCSANTDIASALHAIISALEASVSADVDKYLVYGNAYEAIYGLPQLKFKQE